MAERRGEIERHLADMREWYCRKLRELAGIPESAARASQAAVELTNPAPSGSRDILSLTGDVEPADRHWANCCGRWGWWRRTR